MRNLVQLITYANRLGRDLGDTADTVRTVFAGACGGVHILPFFDPIDHARVDTRLGSWGEVRALASTHDVVVDVVVNRVSSPSQEFPTLNTVCAEGATARDVTTFSAQEIDINVASEAGGRYLGRILDRLAASGVTAVRLDAVGSAIKEAGSSCVMKAPTLAFIDEFTAEAHARGLEVLVEGHAQYQRQIEIAARVDWVYDFALSPLLLHALTTGDAAPLGRWLDARPANSITVLDTHDGIGVADVGPCDCEDGPPGLLTPVEIESLVEGIHVRTGGESRRATGAHTAHVDTCHVNTTYYSALGGDDWAYLAARSLQFFVPGVPQVYYVGALAGTNDMELLTRTGVGPDINRHRFTPVEIAERAETPVVASLLALMRFRNDHPAFRGRAKIHHSREHIAIDWWLGRHWARLRLDTPARRARLSWSTADGTVEEVDDLLSLSATLRWDEAARSAERVGV